MNQKYPFSYLALPYEHSALEPVISSETLHYHHGRHYKTYVDNLNAALEKAPKKMREMTLEELILYTARDLEHYRNIYNNAGGVYNHQLYFENMTPKRNSINKISKEFYRAVTDEYGSIENMLDKLADAAIKVFGSGYAWLCKDVEGSLVIVMMANQDNPITKGFIPLLALDVWEHAYYLDYRNVRKDYVNNWLDIIDWDVVSKRY
ncbi:MAG: superoxide dismutase [Lachnospiraceae bacterium]|nr:superoxide dismutase [Lachnospiraceae bacterium]